MTQSTENLLTIIAQQNKEIEQLNLKLTTKENELTQAAQTRIQTLKQIEQLRSFIRTHHLTSKWEEFMRDNNINL